MGGKVLGCTQVTLKVTQRAVEVIVRLDMREAGSTNEYPSYCKVIIEEGKGVSAQASSWKLCQELLIRPSSMHRSTPQDKVTMVNIRLKKVSQPFTHAKDNLTTIHQSCAHLT